MRSACGVARSALHIHMSTHSTILPSPRGQVSLRRNGSIRRTSTIDVTWSNGRWSTRTVAGAGRDIYTPDSGGKKDKDKDKEKDKELRGGVGTAGPLIQMPGTEEKK